MIYKPLVAALAFSATVFATPIPQDDVARLQEIVGGVAANAGDFPFIVSIQTSGGSHFCGGALLNANTVITAAHCSTGQSASAVRIRAGSLNRSSGGVISGVSSIRVHPNYSSSTINNDVAIWKLSTSIPTSSTISYATIPASGYEPATGLVTTAAGWGTTSSGSSASPTLLRKVDVPIVARATCRASYGTSAITDAMICAGYTTGGRDSCQGDSGGPLIDANTRTLVGVVSWGYGCALANYPGVYAHLGNPTVRSFIASNL